MKVTQYALSFLDNEGNRKFALSNCDIVELSGKCLFTTRKTAEKSLLKLNKTLPLRVNNLKEASLENSEWKIPYLRDKEMLDNGVEVVEVELNVN